jgi:hypothetical protein
MDTWRSDENIYTAVQPTLSLRQLWHLRRCIGAYVGAYAAPEARHE